MSKLIVYTYNTEEKASEVLKALVTLKQENIQKPLVQFEDAAVVIKNAKGKVKVRQTLESAVKGGNVASGGLWGLLIGFLFGGPLLGALLGMGLNGLFGRNIDLGIDNEFIKQVGDDLSPGDSALFMLVGDTTIETVAGALGEHGGNLYHTNLDPEAADILAKAGEHEPIAAALSSSEDA